MESSMYEVFQHICNNLPYITFWAGAYLAASFLVAFLGAKWFSNEGDYLPKVKYTDNGI